MSITMEQVQRGRAFEQAKDELKALEAAAIQKVEEARQALQKAEDALRKISRAANARSRGASEDEVLRLYAELAPNPKSIETLARDFLAAGH